MTCGLTRSPIITIKISQLNETWKLGTRHATSLLKYLPFAIPYIQASILSIFISFCFIFIDILLCTCALQDVDLHCVWLRVGRFAGVVAGIGGDRSACRSGSRAVRILSVWIIPVHQQHRAAPSLLCHYCYSSSCRPEWRRRNIKSVKCGPKRIVKL